MLATKKEAREISMHEIQSKKNDMRWHSASLPPLKPITVTPKPMWRIHADILGPLEMSTNGNQYVAIAVDALTKYVEAMRNPCIILMNLKISVEIQYH